MPADFCWPVPPNSPIRQPAEVHIGNTRHRAIEARSDEPVSSFIRGSFSRDGAPTHSGGTRGSESVSARVLVSTFCGVVLSLKHLRSSKIEANGPCAQYIARRFKGHHRTGLSIRHLIRWGKSGLRRTRACCSRSPNSPKETGNHPKNADGADQGNGEITAREERPSTHPELKHSLSERQLYCHILIQVTYCRKT